MKEIRITCTGSDYIHYKNLLPLQGNIKSLPKKNKIALRKSIMINPSAVKISLMGITYRRYHHLIDWEYAVPKILRNASEVKQ